MMLLPSSVRVWIATGHTDMRRGMNSLALLVQEAFKRDPRGGAPFRDGDQSFQAMVITDSSDRDHAQQMLGIERRRTRLTIVSVLVSRFRRSYHFAACPITNVGSKGTLATL